MNSAYKILLVEDDEYLTYLLGEHLTEHKYEPTICGLGKKALDKFKSERFDLCIVDIVLPDTDGIELAKEIKKLNQDVPIVFLTSRNLRSDKMLGYQVGADDYITKPFDVDILMLKINAIINRCYKESESTVEILSIGEYTLEVTKKRLVTTKTSVKLSNTECGILKALLKANGNPISREDIMNQAWGKNDFFISKSLDVYITRIRKILKEHTSLQLETIHSFGYSLSA